MSMLTNLRARDARKRRYHRRRPDDLYCPGPIRMSKKLDPAAGTATPRMPAPNSGSGMLRATRTRSEREESPGDDATRDRGVRQAILWAGAMGNGRLVRDSVVLLAVVVGP